MKTQNNVVDYEGIAKTKLRQGETLGTHRTINNGHTECFNVMRKESGKMVCIARIHVTDDEAERYSMRG